VLVSALVLVSGSVVVGEVVVGEVVVGEVVVGEVAEPSLDELSEVSTDSATSSAHPPTAIESNNARPGPSKRIDRMHRR
jgi:hypothetical protein